MKRIATDRRSLVLSVILLFTPAPAHTAAEPETLAVLKLFLEACLINDGDAERVRAYAEEQKYDEVMLEGPLKSLLVDGGPGAVWDLPRTSDKIFALAVQDKPETCTIWVESINTEEILTYFRTLRDGFERRGVIAKIERDEPLQTSTGVGRLIMMSSISEQSGAFIYTLAVADQPASLAPGTPFQAAMELRTVSRR